MTAILTMFKDELRLSKKYQSELLMPVLFCVLVVSLFPIGIGPGPETLQLIGPGVIWVTALLSALLGMEKMFSRDFDNGSLEQLLLSGNNVSLMVLVKVVVHWVLVILPLVIISPLLALFLNLTFEMYVALLATLLLGTPLLSLVGAIAVAVTLAVDKGGILIALLILPVFIPLLIFATSAVDSAGLNLNYWPQLGIIGAMLLFALALAPFAISYALRVSHQ